MAQTGPQRLKTWRAYPHIVLAFIVVLAILGVRGALHDYYVPLLAIALLAIISKAVRDGIEFFSKCVTPILMGLLVVMVYFQVYQTQEIFGFNIKETFGLDATEILKHAQFDEGYREPFYSAISTLYAIIIALALVKGMEDVDDIRQSIAEESHRIRSIWNYLKYFEDEELSLKSRMHRDGFRRLLLDYLKNIPRGAGTGNPQHNQKVLDGCRVAILNIEPYDRDDKIAQHEIMLSLETIGIMRAKRLGANCSKVSSYLMAALWVMSLALLLPFLAEPLCVDPNILREQIGTERFAELDKALCQDNKLLLSPQRFSQYYMIFIIVSFFSFLMFMLHDLSSPDKGFWRVDHSAFDDLHVDLREELTWLPNVPMTQMLGLGLGFPDREQP